MNSSLIIHAICGFLLLAIPAGALYLWDPEGNLVDSISYPATPCPDVSWGRILDGSAHWQFKCTATAGSANRSEGTMVQLPAPTIRLVDDSIEIAVEPFDAPTNTYLYYTCDGSTPNFSSPRIAVGSPKRLPDEGSQVVRARLLSPHAMPSPTTTRSFIHHPRPTNLPIISLSTDNHNLYSEEDGILIGSDWSDNCSKQWERPLYLEYFEPTDSQQPTAKKRLVAMAMTNSTPADSGPPSRKSVMHEHSSYATAATVLSTPASRMPLCRSCSASMSPTSNTKLIVPSSSISMACIAVSTSCAKLSTRHGSKAI